MGDKNFRVFGCTRSSRWMDALSAAHGCSGSVHTYSNGRRRDPFKVEIAGSNPAGVTTQRSAEGCSGRISAYEACPVLDLKVRAGLLPFGMLRHLLFGALT